MTHKPQHLFSIPIDNSRENPFVPRIKSKPFAIIPLDLSLHKQSDSYFPDDHSYMIDVGLTSAASSSESLYCANPYELELNELKYNDTQLGTIDHNEFSNQKYKPSPAKVVQYVSTIIQLQVVHDILFSNTSEVGVRLFEHSYHSFQGFTCVLSIATKDSVYIIDALVLCDSISDVLGSIFSNPNIIKVFHDGANDILRLQRDFGLYTVNCFDTYFAAKFLRYPNCTLDHCVKFHFGLNVSDLNSHQYELSCDWRTRPLSDVMTSCIRDRTYYLPDLFLSFRRIIYAKYGREGVETVLEAARKHCLQHYEKPAFHAHGYMTILESRKIDIRSVSLETKAVLFALWDWRDRVARQIDESVEYVLPIDTFLRVAMQVPSTPDELASLCSESAEYFLSRKEEILLIISTQIKQAQNLLLQHPVSPTRHDNQQMLFRSLDVPTRSKSPSTSRSSKSHSPISVNSHGAHTLHVTDNTLTSPVIGIPHQRHQMILQQQGQHASSRSRTGSQSPSRSSTPTNPHTHNPAAYQSAPSNSYMRSHSDQSHHSGNNSGNNSASSSYGALTGGTSMFATFMPAVVPTMPHCAATEQHRASPVLPPEEIYKLAGWLTPQPGTHEPESVFSPQDLFPSNATPVHTNQTVNCEQKPTVEIVSAIIGSPIEDEALTEELRAKRRQLEQRRKQLTATLQQLKQQSAQSQTRSQYHRLSRKDSEPLKVADSSSGDIVSNNEAIGASDQDKAKEKDKNENLASSVENQATTGNFVKDGIRTSGALSEKKVKHADEEEDDVISLTGVPTTFEEIYELSNRNRKRNKDKKKSVRDSDEVDSSLGHATFTIDTSLSYDCPSEGVSLVIREDDKESNSMGSILPSLLPTPAVNSSESAFDESIYFSTMPSKLPEDVVGYTLDIAQSLGWLQNPTTVKQLRVEGHKLHQATNGTTHAHLSPQRHVNASHNADSGVGVGVGAGSGGSGGGSGHSRSQAVHSRSNSNDGSAKSYDFSSARGGVTTDSILSQSLDALSIAVPTAAPTMTDFQRPFNTGYSASSGSGGGSVVGGIYSSTNNDNTGFTNDASHTAYLSHSSTAPSVYAAGQRYSGSTSNAHSFHAAGGVNIGAGVSKSALLSLVEQQRLQIQQLQMQQQIQQQQQSYHQQQQQQQPYHINQHQSQQSQTNQPHYYNQKSPTSNPPKGTRK